MTGVNIDITERKKIEQELAESEERYRLILETANSGVFFLDFENKIKYLNQNMAKILGYAIPEMLDVDIKQFMDINGQKNISKFMEGWKKGMNKLNGFKFVHKDGSTFWALLAASPMVDVNGEYFGVIGVITDINARKGVEKALMEREKISKAILYDMMGLVNNLMKKEVSKKEFEEFNTNEFT
jgi:PAS domain S-box-containing protein